MSDTHKEIDVREKSTIEHNGSEPMRTGIRFSPAVDIFETEESLTLLADLPGVTPGALDIDLNDKKLTITGHVDAREGDAKAVYGEYPIGGYSRRFELGDSIDKEGITASLQDGVLTLVLPKAEKVKPRKIAVASA